MHNKKTQRGKLGPHETIEAQLMLNGKKEVACFPQDYPEELLTGIKENIKNGKFHFFEIDGNSNNKGIEGIFSDTAMVVYLPHAKEKAIRLGELLLLSRKTGYIEEIEREIGNILGYSKEDIDFYIAHILAN